MSVDLYKKLISEKVKVVLTTCPAGLGHIRVMDALLEGVPKKMNVEILGISDSRMQMLHRITSRNELLRSLMEFVQNNTLAESAFTYLYEKGLSFGINEIEHQLADLLLRSRPKPELLVVVATHFGLGYQAGLVKKQIADKLDVRVMVAVVVTDDSPQKVWAIEGADLIFVPSQTTRTNLQTHFLKGDDKLPKILVTPYPVTLKLQTLLNKSEYTSKLKQMRVHETEDLKVMIPISGAAVQLSYFQDLITSLCTDRLAKIVVVARQSEHTHDFLDWCQQIECVEVLSSTVDKEVVDLYEKAYAEEVVAVEVTKPSEQSFKSLFNPKQRGGSILLFSDPVGRQEDENVAFMRRHNLLPQVVEQRELEDWFKRGEKNEKDAKQLLQKARRWRGLMLPLEGYKAGKMIWWLKEVGLLTAMTKFEGFSKGHPGLSDDGVKQIWDNIADEVNRVMSLKHINDLKEQEQ